MISCNVLSNSQLLMHQIYLNVIRWSFKFSVSLFRISTAYLFCICFIKDELVGTYKWSVFVGSKSP